MGFKSKAIRLTDVLIMTFIIIVSFGHYLPMIIPEGLMELDLFFFKIGNSGFYDVKSLLHFIEMRTLIIIFSSIWYITCQSWWKPAILIVITIEMLKLFSTFNPNQVRYDEIEFFTSMPITIPIISLLIYFSNKLNKYNLTKEVRKQIDVKIDTVFSELYDMKKSKLNEIEKKFMELKSNKGNIDSNRYISELHALRNEYYKTLE